MNQPLRIAQWLRRMVALRPLDLRKAASPPLQPPEPQDPPGLPSEPLVPGMQEPLGREFPWWQ